MMMRRQVPFEYVKRMYGVPVERGMPVRVDGKPGVVASAIGQYIGVRFDGSKDVQPCHPTWRVDYLNPGGSVMASYE